MASPASDTELAFVLTFSYKILDSHKVASGSTQSRCPSPPSCLCGPRSASVPLPSSWKPAWGSLALPKWDPSVPIFLHSHCCQVVWSYSTGCRVSRILNSPVPDCEPRFVLGTHMPAVHILRFMVSHTRQFLQSLPAALLTLPLIRGQHESSVTLRAPAQFNSCELTPSAGPQLTRPAWTRLLSVRAQGRTPTVGIHWGFLVNMLFCF